MEKVLCIIVFAATVEGEIIPSQNKHIIITITIILRQSMNPNM